MRAWLAILGSASVIGGAIALVMVHVAIRHNPQGEFVNQETGALDYPYLAALFLSWSLLISVAASLVLALAGRAVRALRIRGIF